jgi:hypothetical protein
MTELAAHLADSVFPAVPVRQFVLTVPFRFVGLLSWNAELRGKVLSAFMRALQAHYRRQALAVGASDPQFAAISVLQRFNGSLCTFPHWHVLCPDGAWDRGTGGLKFTAAPALDAELLGTLLTDAVQRIERRLAKHDAKRDPADARDELDGADPAIAALVRNSLFGKDQLERSEGAEKSTKPARKAVAAKRLEDAGNCNVRILMKNEWNGGGASSPLSCLAGNSSRA